MTITTYRDDQGVDDSLPPGLTPESAFYACDGPREQRKQRLLAIAHEAQDWADTWGSSAAHALANEAWEYLGED